VVGRRRLTDGQVL